MAINKVIYGNEVKIDLTLDTLTASKLTKNVTAHDRSGNQVTGTFDFAEATQATAIADDVTEGKTGWANGVQIIGTKKGIPTWADGTDAEIADALTRHYNNEINLHDYWTVGDERVVSLSAMSAYSPLTDTHAEQDVVMVLVNEGGKDLVTPINGHTECAFVVGQKDCLLETGAMYASTSNRGWASSDRRSWCNNAYYNAIPSTLRSIFKQHINKNCNSYQTAGVSNSTDYFCLPAVKEVTGVRDSADMASIYLEQFSYYEVATNRIKRLGIKGNANGYWTNSKYYTTSSSSSTQRLMFRISDSGGHGGNSVVSMHGIAPQGVI